LPVRFWIACLKELSATLYQKISFDESFRFQARLLKR
jgi:hypothetical protein